MTFKNTGFTFSTFYLRNDVRFKFELHENIIYFLPTSDILRDMVKDILGYYDGKYWKITQSDIKSIVGETVNKGEIIKGFLVISKNNYFYIFSTDLKLVYEGSGVLFDILIQNNESSSGWLHIGIDIKRYLYSTSGGLIDVSDDEYWEVNNDTVIVYNNNKCSGYNNKGHKFISDVTIILCNQYDYIVFIKDNNTMGCYSCDGDMIVDNQDTIEISQYFVIGQKGTIYTIHNRYWGKILEGEYESIIPQMGCLITKNYGNYELYLRTGKKLYTGKEFMYITDKKIVYTMRNNKLRKKPLDVLIQKS